MYIERNFIWIDQKKKRVTRKRDRDRDREREIERELFKMRDGFL